MCVSRGMIYILMRKPKPMVHTCSALRAHLPETRETKNSFELGLGWCGQENREWMERANVIFTPFHCKSTRKHNTSTYFTAFYGTHTHSLTHTRIFVDVRPKNYVFTIWYIILLGWWTVAAAYTWMKRENEIFFVVAFIRPKSVRNAKEISPLRWKSFAFFIYAMWSSNQQKNKSTAQINFRSGHSVRGNRE